MTSGESKKWKTLTLVSLSSLFVGKLWPEKKAYLESTGIKMSNAEGGGDTSAQVFHFSRRALWTLSTQSGQRVASITVTVPATCNVGNNNSFKTLQWGVTALCRTWESHLWQAAENLFWTQSLQRAICFDSSTCFWKKLSLDLIDNPFLSLCFFIPRQAMGEDKWTAAFRCIVICFPIDFLMWWDMNWPYHMDKMYSIFVWIVRTSIAFSFSVIL